MNLLTAEDLLNMPMGEAFVYDVESYPNYFVCGFKHINSGAVYFVEDGFGEFVDVNLLRLMLSKFCMVGFNSNAYDQIIIAMALEGYSCEALYKATKELIVENVTHKDIQKMYDFVIPKFNHIDLIEVCPLTASLKIYGGRLHCQKMQDLPYTPGQYLTKEEAQQVKLYNVNDLDITALIAVELRDQISLRYSMSKQYGLDLRSKSDAQIAEAVIVSEVVKLTGRYPTKPKIPAGTLYKYNKPSFAAFKTKYMQDILDIICDIDFEVLEAGSFAKPQALKDLDIVIGNTAYTIGIGGLHSKEKCVTHRADETYKLIDRDVTSYYPNIILNLQLFPKHIGYEFLNVYKALVDRRVAAKNNKDNIVADALKIVINGSFGKLGSKYSALYSPDLMLAVTITGQISLLMLIETIELAGIAVVSANTDGIVIKCPRDREAELNEMISVWEYQTGFNTEDTEYKILCSRDVNNYIAVKTDGKCKGKGAYSNHWNDKKSAIFRFHKNPETLICIEAVYAYLDDGTPIEKTIRECNDVSKFVTVRAVKGGAVKDGVYLGKAVRWYHPINEAGAIHYKSSGNKVATSDRAKPLMDFDGLPDDIDCQFYIEKANTILYDIGFKKKIESFF